MSYVVKNTAINYKLIKTIEKDVRVYPGDIIFLDEENGEITEVSPDDVDPLNVK